MYTDLVWKYKPSNQCDIPEFLVDAETTAKEGAAPASVALNRNTFHLENSGGVFTNVTGSANSAWQITVGDSTALPSDASAWVEARGSVSGIAHLELSGKPNEAPNLQVTNNVTATKLTMNDAAWLKTVGVRNTRNHQMTSGKIAVTNLTTNGENNKVSYPGENTASMLYVTARLTVTRSMEPWRVNIISPARLLLILRESTIRRPQITNC